MFDLARLLLMTVPIDTPEDAARTVSGLDPFVRVRWPPTPTASPPTGPGSSTPSSATSPAGVFLQRRIDRGEQAFLAMRDQMGGMARYDRRRAWFAAHRERFLASVG